MVEEKATKKRHRSHTRTRQGKRKRTRSSSAKASESEVKRVPSEKKKRKKQQKKKSADKAKDAPVDKELVSINALLQEEETSQKQTWQIGKRVKKLLESHTELPQAKQLDAYFLWGTALARLASLNEDPTLAAAAADKFQQMLELCGSDSKDEDAADAALGPVGFSLWGSSLLIVATETQSRQVLDEALSKFQKSVEVDGGTTFETRFQYAKALKEGGDLVAFLEENRDAKGGYYHKALEVCVKLEEIYKEESAKEEKSEDKEDEKDDDSNDSEDEEDDDSSYSEEEEDDDEDEDTVTAEDFAEAKLLEAVLQGLLENATSVDDFHRTLALYQEAIGKWKDALISLNHDSAEALMEMTNYLAARCLARASLGAKPTGNEWAKLFGDLESQYNVLLADAGFDLQECHEICRRKDEHDQEEPEEEEIDERVPHLLNALGKGLAAFVRAYPQLEGEGELQKSKQKQKCTKTSGGARFTHAVEVLRSAHHFHDKLGGYYLACLYASSVFEDEENCRTWLETADSYGSLDDEFDVEEFTSMHEKEWFQRLAQPPVAIDVNGEDDEDGNVEEGEKDNNDDDEEENL
ncbi:hypothetical protein BBO99_00007521 [Phytophthora kernoviae]|uniref:Uncharacterized protein n=1 Tax=Phytophthora kernoviae TaxID=325452 RepID=A0A421GHR1_9STRA|nr:hypothetical protein JM16_007075 [Phytophthora kernoviae]RLN02294.1 hypothetical protein BBI17_007477 [Phytophthora kernoviae]RLN76485.1 hypothetical protein BBO99_00007521 [Phytophthora kernoviae]